MAEKARIPGGRQVHSEDFRLSRTNAEAAASEAEKITRLRERSLERLAQHLPEHREYMREAVSVINDIVEQECARLGLIDEKRAVHPLVPEQFLLSTVNHVGSIGQASQVDGTAVLDIVKMHFGSPEFIRVLLHESIHLLDVSRFGYGAYDSAVRTAGYEQRVHGGLAFRPLYEAVLEDYACELLQRYRHLIEPIVRVHRETYDNEIRGVYRNERNVYDRIISGIVRSKGGTPAKLKIEFQKRLFTGAFMPLRDIERVFGRGTLRVLSAIDLYDANSKESRDMYRRVNRFLDARSNTERFAIGREIMFSGNYVDLGRYLDRFYDPAEFGRMRTASIKELTSSDLSALERSIDSALMMVESFRKGSQSMTSEHDKYACGQQVLLYKKFLRNLEDKRRQLSAQPKT